MKYIFFPIKDASIYEATASLNTGQDQILEISHDKIYNTRTLVQFDMENVENFISDKGIGNNNLKFELKMFTTKAETIPLEFNVDIYPVSESWYNGVGKWQHQPYTTFGVSWANRGVSLWDVEQANPGATWQEIYEIWNAMNQTWASVGLTPSASAYWITNQGGGNWYPEYKVSQSFNYKTKDIDVNVTNIANRWLSGSLANNGFIFKFDNVTENNPSSSHYINFFGNETNTIFVPQLQLSWDDSVYITGSLPTASIHDVVLNPKLKREYFYGEDIEVEITARPKYPTPTFSTTSSYLQNYRLPSSSYYQIVDNLSKNVIIDFSDHTKISHANNRNYFNLCVDFLFPKRTYLLKIKMEQNGRTVYHTHKFPFMVLK